MYVLNACVLLLEFQEMYALNACIVLLEFQETYKIWTLHRFHNIKSGCTPLNNSHKIE